MKNLILLLFAAFVVPGCKKEYSCVCTNPGGDEIVFTAKDSRDDVKKKCDDYYNEHFASIPWNETTCAIK